MSKVSGSYASVVRGVSQQIPEQRLAGQHKEQVNMLSDPVTGLTRRRGTIMSIESPLFTGSAAAKLADHRAMRTKDFTVGLNQYTLLYRKQARPAGSDLLGLMCYNKTGNAVVPVATHGSDTKVLSMLAEGVSSITQVGRYVLLASNQHVAEGTSVDNYTPTSNSRYATIWIRGGAYSRTFTATVAYVGGTSITATYTTPASSYPGTLDTSDILASDPEYQKKVNDRVNAYNNAVTQWLGTAAAAIQPAAIAASLQSAMAAAGIAGTSRDDATIVLSDVTISSVTIADGGDGTLARAVHQEVAEANQVTSVHYIGKIVKVQPQDDAQPFYLVAKPKIPGASGWGQVVWEEGPAVSFTPGVWFMLATVEAGTFYVASTPALLSTLTGLSVPGFESRSVGDADTSKTPYFVGRPINFLASFQDRLIVGSGAVYNMSKIGDYFNFFRTSVLTVLDDDPAEVYALGGEDDVIRHAVIYNKSLLAFGDQRQYGISGRVPVTPKTTSVIQSSAHVNTADTAPVASGDLVFYLQRSDGYARLYQLQTADIDDTTISADVGNQLNTYIPGTPVELLATTAPNMLFVRTDADPRTIYTFRYLDVNGGRQRVQDAWSRWEFNAKLGDLIGMSYFQGALLLFWSRVAVDAAGQERTYLVVDRQSLLSGLPGTPYLDSLRPYTAVLAGASTRPVHAASTNVHTAFDNTSYAYLQGEDNLAAVPGMLAEFPTIPNTGLWSGYGFESYYIPTSPRIRDKNDVAIVNGRLTVTRVDLSVKQTGGLLAEVTTDYAGTVTALDFNGRVLGAVNNNLDEQPLSTSSVPVFIGREVREYDLTVRAKKWLPLTVAGMGWIGQFFYGPRRV